MSKRGSKIDLNSSPKRVSNLNGGGTDTEAQASLGDVDIKSLLQHGEMASEVHKVLVYGTLETDTTDISIENYKRVMFPIEFIRDSYPDIILSDSIFVSDELIFQLVNGLYSKSYIDIMISDSTLCTFCTYENSLDCRECTICNQPLDKSVLRGYKDGDPDTVFTSVSKSQILNVLRILHQISIDFAALRFKYAYALIRPPGHHSTLECHSGFCVINNVFILARSLLETRIRSDEKLLIFDWDLHHGDGTENLVSRFRYPNLYYASIHGFEANFYPGTGSGSTNGPNILNIPLPRGTTDGEYRASFDSSLAPFLSAHAFSTILVSNGLDAHQEDYVKFMGLSDDTFLYMTQELKKTGANLIFLLEGGYNVDVIGRVSLKILDTLREG